MEMSDRPSQSSGSRSWHSQQTQQLPRVGSYRRRRKRRRKPWPSRIADWTRALIAFLFSNVGIVCLVVGYTIAGAFLFTYIETDSDAIPSNNPTLNVHELRNLAATTLWELTSKENVFSEKAWKRKVTEILEKYQEKMVIAINEGYDGVDTVKQWTFPEAFLYSLTVITTIGYGNICPRTIRGKLATIVYAIVGMPLFLLYLSNIGDILATSFKWTYARCCLCRCRRRPRHSPITSEASQARQEIELRRNRWQMVQMQGGEVETSSIEQEKDSRTNGNEGEDGDDENDDDDDEEDDDDDDRDDSTYDPQQVTVPLTLCLAIMVGYICGGALLFSEYEDWNFLDGSYFCFISLSTIGFGDIVPGDKIYNSRVFDLSFIFCSMYLMLGMALIAMCFNLMQEEVIAKLRTAGRVIKHIFRCDR
ncbi:potassium channel subfamily K member 18 isoform X5 [Prorops nasuta]|uniref:potassium channel subfamily K member 18 isoform X5 n=1 Tax=Prorops nasuta TaxID=863751 RepID=UPI0034CEBB5C